MVKQNRTNEKQTTLRFPPKTTKQIEELSWKLKKRSSSAVIIEAIDRIAKEYGIEVPEEEVKNEN